MKVASFSPMPPERSGIADYTALLLPALRERLEIEVVKRGKRKLPRGCDIGLFQIGNDPDAHAWIVQALRRSPGVVVLHEIVLHHLVAGLTLARRDSKGYLDAMEREGGLAARLLAFGVIESKIPPLWETRPEDFPLAGEILDLAAAGGGLIVHSRYVEQGARAAGYAGPVFRVPHPAWPAPALEPARIDPPTGAPGGVLGPVIGCFGHLNAAKRVPQLLEAFAQLRRTHPGAKLLLVGAKAPRFELDQRIEKLGLGDSLQREEYVPEERLWSLMAAADIHVCLRAPTMGETSGSALRALSLGKPLVVSELGWFAELPAAVALKVPVDEHETRTLAGALALLADDPAARRAMGEAALHLAQTEHSVAHVADLYAAALVQAAGGGAVADAVLGEVARAAAAVGIGGGATVDAATAEIAERLREVGLGR